MIIIIIIIIIIITILSSSLLSKNILVKIYRFIVLPVFCMGVKLGGSH